MAESAIIKAILTLQDKDFTTGLERSEGKLAKFGQRMTRVGRDITFSLSIPLAAAARAAINTGIQFDLIQRKIGALGGTDKIRNLEKSAKNLGATTIFTASQIADLQLNLRKLGQTAPEIQSLQEVILKFAQAMDADLAESGKFIVQTMNRYAKELDGVGNKTEQAEFVTNVFAKAMANSALQSDTLRSSLNFAGSELAQYDVSLTSTTALLAVLADRGFEASRGGTALRRIFAELAKDGFKSDEAILKLLSSTGGFAEQLKEFGLRGAGSASALAGLTEEFKQLKEVLEDSDGFTDVFAEFLGESTFAKLRELISALEALGLVFFETIQPAFDAFLETTTKVIRNLRFLDESTQKLVVGSVALGAILGPLLLVLGGLANTVAFLLKPLNSLVRLLLTRVVPMLTKAALRLGALGNVYLFIALGIATGANKIRRAFKEVEENEAALNASIAKTTGFLFAQVDAFKSLNDLKPDEIIKRINDGAIGLMLGAQSEGAAMMPPEDIADKFVPQEVFDKIVGRFEQLKSDIAGVETFGQVITDAQLLAQAIAEFTKTPETTNDPIEPLRTSIRLLKKELTELADERAKALGLDLAPKARENKLVDPAEIDLLDSQIKKLQGTLKGFQRDTDLVPLSADSFKTLTGEIQDNSDACVDNLAPALRIVNAELAVLDAMFDNFSNTPFEIVPEEATTNGFINIELLLKKARELENVAFSIGRVFGDAFFQMAEGTANFADALASNLMTALNQVAAKLVSLIIAYGVLLALSGGSGALAATASNAMGSNMGTFLLNGFGLTRSQESGLRVQGVLSGNDLAVSTRRGVTANSRIYG